MGVELDHYRTRWVWSWTITGLDGCGAGPGTGLDGCGAGPVQG